MIKKLKIKIKGGELTRLVFSLGDWEVPLFEYGKKDDKRFINRLILKFFKQDENEDIFYLKANSFNILIIQHWINIIPENSKIFFIIDKKDVKKEIINIICFKNEKVYFIKSNRGHLLKNWIKKIKLNKYWYNTGYAHLTTFWHAQKYKFKNFWNIDADDTLMCIDAPKACLILKEVKNYAEKNKIDILSQDFYYSWNGDCNHWSFGISYMRNQFKLKDYLNFDYTFWLNGFRWRGTMNLDCYFNYLKDYMPNLKLKIYAPKNLLFFHFCGLNSLKRGPFSFMQYKEDRIEYPLISSFYNINDIAIGYVPRNKNTILIDIGLNEKDGMKWLTKYLLSPNTLLQQIWKKIAKENITPQKIAEDKAQELINNRKEIEKNILINNKNKIFFKYYKYKIFKNFVFKERYTKKANDYHELVRKIRRISYNEVKV